MRLTLAALDKLHQHSWPGNIRELRSVIRRALLLRQGLDIDAGDISWDLPPRELEGPSDGTLRLPEGLTLEQALERMERQLVNSTLRRNDNNKERAARQLGLSRSTLFRRLKQWASSPRTRTRTDREPVAADTGRTREGGALNTSPSLPSCDSGMPLKSSTALPLWLRTCTRTASPGVKRLATVCRTWSANANAGRPRKQALALAGPQPPSDG